jgi:sugar O-acyltransferase (sialic acid O-acetyltransferase NeuD family)
MKDVAIYGAGGFGQEIACLIHLINQENPTWHIIGFFDDKPSLKGTRNRYGVILGGIDELNAYQNPLSVVIAIADPLAVKKVVRRIKNEHVDFPNLIAPSTIFLDAETVKMGKGNIVCSRCLISYNVTMGDFNIFDGYIPIGHDSKIGSCNVVMPSVNISGGVVMGDCNFLGVQSVVLQNLTMGNQVRIGANSVMIRNGNDGTTYFGNPAEQMLSGGKSISEIDGFIKKFEDVFEDTDICTLKPDTPFRDLDEWTSMMALSTMAMVSCEYDVELTADEMRHANTFQDLFDTVKSHL